MKGKRLCFGLLLALFIMLGLSLSVFSEDSSAVSDVSGILDSNTPNYTALCDDNNSNVPNCSDYLYFSLENTSLSTGSSYFIMFDFSPFVTGARLPYYGLSFYSLTGVSSLWFRNPTSFGNNTFSYTLTNTFGSTCPEIEPCPVIPDYPYEDDLVNIRNAILLCGGAILVIYFFYAIYKMILGGL